MFEQLLNLSSQPKRIEHLKKLLLLAIKLLKQLPLVNLLCDLNEVAVREFYQIISVGLLRMWLRHCFLSLFLSIGLWWLDCNLSLWCLSFLFFVITSEGQLRGLSFFAPVELLKTFSLKRFCKLFDLLLRPVVRTILNTDTTETLVDLTPLLLDFVDCVLNNQLVCDLNRVVVSLNVFLVLSPQHDRNRWIFEVRGGLVAVELCLNQAGQLSGAFDVFLKGFDSEISELLKQFALAELSEEPLLIDQVFFEEYGVVTNDVRLLFFLLLLCCF